jgi:asparagine synthase (glutamine-hydrolysing)
VSYALFSSAFIEQLRAGPDSGGTQVGLTRERHSELAADIAGVPALQAISAMELACFVGERLLRDTDTASMASSLEVRVPLLDHEVVEAATMMPTRSRYEPLGRKQMLRELGLGRLDPATFERPKAGFELPIELWSRATLFGEMDRTFNDSRALAAVGLDPVVVGRLWSAHQAGAPGLYWSRVWAIFVLAYWARKYGASI